MSNYTKDVTFSKSIINASGNAIVSDLVGSDTTMTLSVADGSTTVTLVDAATGTINFSPKPLGLGSITVTCVQDNQWPNGESGTFIASPHPITLGEVAQITTNKTDIGHLQDHLHDPATGVDKKIADLESDKVDKVSGKGLSTNDYDDAAVAEVAKITNKVDKVNGKGLSTNDYDDAAVAEVAKIANKADKPTGADNAANGRVILDSSGKIPTSLYDAGSGGGTTYTAGSGISIDENGVISLLDSKVQDLAEDLIDNVIDVAVVSRAVEESKFDAGSGTSLDPHLGFGVDNDSKKFWFKYSKGNVTNTGYPSYVDIAYNFEGVHISQGNGLQDYNKVERKTPVQLTSDHTMYNYFQIGALHAATKNGAVYGLKGLDLKFEVFLTSNGRIKKYSFELETYDHGRFKVKNVEITGDTLSTNKNYKG